MRHPWVSTQRLAPRTPAMHGIARCRVRRRRLPPASTVVAGWIASARPAPGIGGVGPPLVTMPSTLAAVAFPSTRPAGAAIAAPLLLWLLWRALITATLIVKGVPAVSTVPQRVLRRLHLRWRWANVHGAGRCLGRRGGEGGTGCRCP